MLLADEHKQQLQDIHDDVREMRKDIHELRLLLTEARMMNASLSTQVKIQWAIIGAVLSGIGLWVKSKLGI